MNEDSDAGPISLQRAVEVMDGDTAETLAERILVQEHGYTSKRLGEL